MCSPQVFSEGELSDEFFFENEDLIKYRCIIKQHSSDNSPRSDF